MKKMHAFGWKPDIPDHRDFYHISRDVKKLPRVVDLSKSMKLCYNQGRLGSCTANAIAGAVQYCRRKQRQSAFMPSRLFIYYGERVLENSVAYDAGAYIRDGMKVINSLGVCNEVLWPYLVDKFTVKPSDVAFKRALLCQSIKYERVLQTESDLCSCLAGGFPVVFGFSVYESFQSLQVVASGMVPMPAPSERFLGGHAVLLVGYDLDKRLWKVRNSWGIHWGCSGYMFMPFEYLVSDNLAADFWTLTLTE